MPDQTNRSQQTTQLQIPRLNMGQIRLVSLGQVVLAVVGVIGLLFAPASVVWFRLAAILAAFITAIMFSAHFDITVGRFGREVLWFIARNRIRVSLVVSFLLIAWSVGLIAVLWQFRLADLMVGGWLCLLFLALWPWFTLGVLLIYVSSRPDSRQVIINLITGVASVSLFLVLLEGLCQLAFEVMPLTITLRMPQSVHRLYHVNYDNPYGFRQYPPGQRITKRVSGNIGDLVLKSCLKPELTQGESRVFSYTHDEHGFRNPSPWPPKVDLVVMGDSFVYAGGIERPFWQGVRASTLNLGIDAVATLEESLILKTYGLPRSPRIVVLAYYEGNDLTGNWEFFFNGSAKNGYEKWYNGQPLRNFLVTYHMVSLLKDNLFVKNCHWPIVDSFGRKLAFLEEEMSISTVPYATLKQSQLYAITRDAITAMANDVRASGAQFVLAYIPTKFHAYWKSIQGQLETISAHVVSWDLPQQGYVLPRPDRTPQETAALLAQGIDAQRDLISQLARQENFAFLDFTVPFQQVIEDGVDPYFYVDSHWNQTGHNLAREIMHDFLTSNLDASV